MLPLGLALLAALPALTASASGKDHRVSSGGRGMCRDWIAPLSAPEPSLTLMISAMPLLCPQYADGDAIKLWRV